MTKIDNAHSVGTVATTTGGVASESYGMGQTSIRPVVAHPTAPDIARVAIEAREQAHLVLNRLLSDQRCVQRRRRERGTGDPLKSFRGTSALDLAIKSTRAMVSDLDQLVRTLEGDSSTLASMNHVVR